MADNYFAQFGETDDSSFVIQPPPAPENFFAQFGTADDQAKKQDEPKPADIAPPALPATVTGFGVNYRFE